jgi:hypothetical protein
MGDLVGHVRSRFEGVVDLFLVAVFAVVNPPQGELETVSFTSTLERQVCEIPYFFVFVTGLVVEKIAGR